MGRSVPFLYSLRLCLPAAKNSDIAPIDPIDQEFFLTISHSITAALLVLGSLTGVAHGSNINAEASYVAFTVSGALGTYPMAINSSMTVTGYYLTTNNEAHGFIRTADGTIDTFDVGGAVETEPASINAAGDITGFYVSTTTAFVYQTRSFLRYADGRIITFDPPPQAGNAQEATSINDFDYVAGTVTDPYFSSYGFTRSREGVYTEISLANATVATAVNASGSVVGYATPASGATMGFVAHPDGYKSTFTVSAPPDAACTTTGTFPEAVNAEGTIAGWYVCPNVSNGFVMSPEGVVSVFQLPGAIVENRVSINEVGDVTGAYYEAPPVNGSLPRHGFVRNPYGTVTTFDPPDGDTPIFSTQPTGINDAGVITGFYVKWGVTGFLRVPPTGTITQQ